MFIVVVARNEGDDGQQHSCCGEPRRHHPAREHRGMVGGGRFQVRQEERECYKGGHVPSAWDRILQHGAFSRGEGTSGAVGNSEGHAPWHGHGTTTTTVHTRGQGQGLETETEIQTASGQVEYRCVRLQEEERVEG